MGSKTKHIDDLFKQGLGGYTEVPPPNVWEGLDQRLDNITIPKPYFTQWHWMAAALTALIISGLLFLRSVNNNTAVTHAASTVTSENLSNSSATSNAAVTTAPVVAATSNKGEYVAIDPNTGNKASGEGSENANPTPIGNSGYTNSPNTAGSRSDGVNKSNSALHVSGHNNGATRSGNGSNHMANSSRNQQQRIKAGITQTLNSLAAPIGNKQNSQLLAGKSNYSNTEEEPAQTSGRSILKNTNTDNYNGSVGSSKRAHNKATGTNGSAEGTADESVDDATTPVGNSALAKAENVTKELTTPTDATKKENKAPTAPKEMAAQNKQAGKPRFLPGFIIGIKGGLETGYSNTTANKMVISPYFEKKLNNRFSLLIQPALKISNLSGQTLAGGRSYYDITDSSSEYFKHLVLVLPNGDTMWRYDYRLQESYRTFDKTYKAGGRYVEVETPVMLKFKISKKFSIYGGANISYSRYIAISELTNVGATQVLIDSIHSSAPFTDAPANPGTPAVSSVFKIKGQSLSQYQPLYTTPAGGVFRLGYMVGISYQFNNRWMADVLVQQGRARANNIGGYNLNSALSAPYMRFTIGYRIR